MVSLYAEDLGTLLDHLYPGAAERGEYEVSDLADGKGPRLTRWSDTLGAAPTEAALAGARFSVAKDRKKTEVSEAAKAETESIWDTDIPAEMERERAILGRVQGITIDAATRTRAQTHRAVVEKLRTLLAQVDAATTVAEVEAVAWSA